MFIEHVRAEARRALPYALLLTVALGTVVSVGAHLSNAFPSADRPFGWEGPSRMTNAVAMVRGDLVLATSIPALLLGATAMTGRDPLRQRTPRIAAMIVAHVLLLVAAAFLAGAIGASVAFQTKMGPTYLAFSTAHALLALAFWALALLVGTLVRRHAVPVAVGVWLLFNAAYEGLVRIVLFRTEGYHALNAGQFPSWFYVAQALSPLSSYRGTLILWERGFMDALEKHALGDAVLPAWVNPGTFAALMILLWVAVPVGIVLGVWRWRGRGTEEVHGAPRPLPDDPA